MQNPSRKVPKTIRSQFTAGTALVIGRELIEFPKFKEGSFKDNKHTRSEVSKDKISSKLEDIQLEFGVLKVKGKQIGSSFSINACKLQPQLKDKPKTKIFMEGPVQSFLNTWTKQKSHKQEKQSNKKSQTKYESPKKSMNSLIEIDSILHEKQNQSEQNNPFPQISAKQIPLISNPLIQKKTHKYRSSQRQSDRQSHSISKINKRRDTVIEGSANIKEKVTFNDQYTKTKQDIKKQAYLLHYRQFLLTITLTNRLVILPEEQVLYRACICKGNNGLLVKSIFKTRPWWSFRPIADIDSCHLVWTEWKRNKSMNQLALGSHKDPVKNLVGPCNLNIKTSNKEIRQKIESKYKNFARIVGKNTNLCQKFDNSILSENYLTLSSKINSKSFQDTLQKSLVGQEYTIFDRNKEKKILNHISGCLYLHSKKLLFLYMSKHYKKLQKDVFNVIPITFLISKGINDPEFQRFCKYFEDFDGKNKKDKKNGNIWICKPGQNSNRGNGIEVFSTLNQIKQLVSQKCGSSRTLIIQKYMQNPYLYNKRKFDIRCYILITCVNGCIKGYWYEQNYVRTTSKEYTLKNLDNKLIHLTNDAIQKKGQEYGKFQNFNKISMGDLEKYIESNSQIKFKIIMNKIQEIATQLIESVAKKINPQHKQFSFEVFGLDFMLDDKLNPFLIEANSNPCLQVDGNVLGRVIPRMIENVIRVAIDPIFPPPYSQSIRNRFSPGNTFESNRMVLVYDSLHDVSWQSREEVEEEVEDEGEANDKECEEFEGEAIIE